MRWTLINILFVGVGWTDLAITLNRIAVGTFFMLSGYHKLFNAERATVQSSMNSRRSAFQEWASINGGCRW
jgi:uncharacterized membrane protein YphA (DoxX/SURF4 family)